MKGLTQMVLISKISQHANQYLQDYPSLSENTLDAFQASAIHVVVFLS